MPRPSAQVLNISNPGNSTYNATFETKGYAGYNMTSGTVGFQGYTQGPGYWGKTFYYLAARSHERLADRVFQLSHRRHADNSQAVGQQRQLAGRPAAAVIRSTTRRS